MVGGNPDFYQGLYFQYSSRWKKEGRLARDLGTKQQNRTVFPGISFSIMYPRLGVKETGSLEILVSMDKNTPIKSCLGEGSVQCNLDQVRKLLDNNCSPLANHNRKIIITSLPLTQRLSGEPRPLPFPG